MEAFASSPPRWLPDDDLLLKNSVEAGASLEALAKGAVRFSRKFTVRELRDRWYSLLYDADVSAEASASMVELEFSAYTSNNNSNSKSGGSKESAEVSMKRKIESVRRLYNTVRKKICRSRSCMSPDPEFIVGLDGNECLGFGELGVAVPLLGGQNLGKDAGCMTRGKVIDFGDWMRAQEMTPCGIVDNGSPFGVEGNLSPLPRVPLWKTIEDVSAPEMPVDVIFDDKSHGGVETLVHDIVHTGDLVDGADNVDALDSSAVISECKFADLSHSLLNIPNDDDFMDVDGKDGIGTSCFDDVNLLLMCSPKDVPEPVVKEPQVLASDSNVEIHAGECVGQPEVVAVTSVLVDVDQHCHFPSKTPSSMPGPISWSAECGDGKILCILNTEDLEIPLNDNITRANNFSSSAVTMCSKETFYLASPRANQKDGQHELRLLNKKDNVAPSVTSFPKVGHTLAPGSSTNHRFVSCGVKCPSPATFSKKASNVDDDQSQCSSAQEISPSPSTGMLKTESLHANDLPLHVKARSHSGGIAEPEDVLKSNQEESVSDDDVPSFSDIEAMILEMDLCPDDSDSLVNTEVSKYQSDDTKRAIMRLEQCARSSMQRAMTSRGAVAVLYGRRLKHYIKETMVLLGRATEDTDVDIDLGREGPANKISRRQALIKMERDGSFVLKNLGKSPIFLNGKEIMSGQIATLKSSSLIEIRRLAFVFEVNSGSTRRHPMKVAKIQEDNNFNFGWSQEGVNHGHGGNKIKFEWPEEGVA